MGGFHAICIFMTVIGKRFASAGLRDIIIEANLVGSGTVEKVLKGKQYNREVRVLKVVYEALRLYTNGDSRILTHLLESYEFTELSTIMCIKFGTNEQYQQKNVFF